MIEKSYFGLFRDPGAYSGSKSFQAKICSGVALTDGFGVIGGVLFFDCASSDTANETVKSLKKAAKNPFKNRPNTIKNIFIRNVLCSQ